MQAGGKDNLFIMTVTEHKCLATLLNYAPVPKMDDRLDGARCIMDVKQKTPKITTEIVTTSQVTKTVSRTSIHHETNQTGQLQSGHRARGQVVNGRDAGGRKAVLHKIAEQG